MVFSPFALQGFCLIFSAYLCSFLYLQDWVVKTRWDACRYNTRPILTLGERSRHVLRRWVCRQFPEIKFHFRVDFVQRLKCHLAKSVRRRPNRKLNLVQQHKNKRIAQVPKIEAHFTGESFHIFTRIIHVCALLLNLYDFAVFDI